MQCHLVQLRGCDTMNCNINGGNMQCHLVGVRGRGHDKSAPTPTGWTWKNISTNNHAIFIFCANVWQQTFRKA